MVAIGKMEKRENLKKVNKSIAGGVKELIKSDRVTRAAVKQQ